MYVIRRQPMQPSGYGLTLFSARSAVDELVPRGSNLIQNSTGAHDIRGNSNGRVRDGFGGHRALLPLPQDRDLF